MHVGAWMDVVALRRWTVWSDARAIGRAYPRGGLDIAFYAGLVRSFGSASACLGLLAHDRFRGTEISAPR